LATKREVEQRDDTEQKSHCANLAPLCEQQPPGEHAFDLVSVECAFGHQQNYECCAHSVDDSDQGLLRQASLGGSRKREDGGSCECEGEGPEIGREGVSVRGQHVPHGRTERRELRQS